MAGWLPDCVILYWLGIGWGLFGDSAAWLAGGGCGPGSSHEPRMLPWIGVSVFTMGLVFRVFRLVAGWLAGGWLAGWWLAGGWLVTWLCSPTNIK